MMPPVGHGLAAAMRALATALDELAAPHMIIGGMAVIVRGVARLTDDVDATIWAEGLDVAGVLDVLRRHGIVGRIPDAADFARTHQVFLLEHQESGTPMELSLGWLPFEREAMARAERIELMGVSVPIARAEDLVIYKAVAWRERDRTDIERLLAAHRGQIDLQRVRLVVREFAAALGEPERVADLDRLIDRAIGERR